MIFDPYILTPPQPIHRLFLRIPLSSKPWQVGQPHNEQALTLDICPLEDQVYILLGKPFWEESNLALYIESICSNLLMLMEAAGIVKKREKVKWFEMRISPPKIQFLSIEFKYDTHNWLSYPCWTVCLPENLPFNVEHFMKGGSS